MALLSPGLLRSLTERRHLAETGAREGEREGGEGRRGGRLLLPRGCSWRAAAQRKHTGLGEAGMNQLPAPE